MSLTEQWLLENQGDPWKLISNSIDGNFPYAFIGNGYIGQQIAPEGEGMLFPQHNSSKSGCLIHGFYSEQPLNVGVVDFVKQHSAKNARLIQESLTEPPEWNTLRYCDGNEFFARNIGQHKDYQQYVDMKTATVVTRDAWLSSAKKITNIETTVYLSYANQNLGVISTTITPNFSGQVYFEDTIDASFLQNTNNCEIETGDIITLSIDVGSYQHRVFEASKLIIPQNAKHNIEFIRTEHKITRKLYLQVSPNHSYTVTKLVGIYTYLDGDDLRNRAKNMLDKAAQNIIRERSAHEREWEKLWEHHIEIHGVSGLQKLVNAALYQFYSQLREGINYSLSPTGITGCQQWAGIIFWDADLWMGPPLALLNPKLAQPIFQYRYQTLNGAKRNAILEECEGARFAWESTASGNETCFVYTANQPHIVSDIALAQWQYYLISGDDNYLNKAAEIIIECAKYWESRVTYNGQYDRYEINQVCCVDEYGVIVNNNTFTNYSAVKTLEIAGKILKLRNEKIPSQWSNIIQKMYLPYDSNQDLYLEHESYNGAMIKQADTALLIYPYEMPMTAQQKQNIVEYYRNRYPKDKIMMSSAIDGIIYCEQQKSDRAWNALLDLLQHFAMPFLSASESPCNNVRSFITGLGGLLQLIINGFCGLRVTENGLTFEPCLPKQIEKIYLRNIHYRGKCFDKEVGNN